MKNYSIVCICQIYNELCKDNLERFVNYVLPLVNHLVVYDDGSTDGSYEYLLQRTPYVIRGTKNDFVNERSHKQLLLEEALKLDPDFILWLDADEVLTANAAEKLQELCRECAENQIDAVNMHEINIWRSNSWQRLDSLYDQGWFCRLWRVVPGICFHDTKPGLHQPLFPSTIRSVKWTLDVQVLHYGFSSEQRLAYKYLIYKSHGQRGYDMLDRLISEEKLVTERVPQELFPEGLWIDDEKPQPLTFEESLAYVENYREEVFRPRFSIVCLVYKSVEWLKFVYEQVFKFTDMSDKEFFFVANDANASVLNYLADHYIPHYVFTNTPEQQKEWYVNNVYRAYNFAAAKAQGDFVIFINTDMAFSPGWFDHLWQAYDGKNCVASRLVESGKLPSGQFGVERDYGRDYSTYREDEFLKFARELSESRVMDGGLFMPLLIRKEHFEGVGGYPEGQVLMGSDLNHPVIARRGEACISGDTVLTLKLKVLGIKHQTAFDSIVYHFQWGEIDSLKTASAVPGEIKIAVCNDLSLGSMQEKVFWTALQKSLPASVDVHQQITGLKGNYTDNSRNYINQHHPEVEVILQNATFINTIDKSRYTIAFLQDNVRSQNIDNEQQEENLRRADRLVTNSIQTALAYPEYDFEIISDGVDATPKWRQLLQAVFKELMIKKVNSQRKAPGHKVSIIITTFQRTHLLRWGLYSLSLQKIPYEFETIVVNDGIEDETETICSEFKEKLNLKYIFTGQRNVGNDPVWRVPGFAINIGVKQATGDILVMCCAEMFHVNGTIAKLTKRILDNPKLLGIPVGKDDRTGALLASVDRNNGIFEPEVFAGCVGLDTRMPFLMALHRSQFIEIGGYDEDFVGVAYDDRDLIDRLLLNGCRYCPTDAVTVHLYHPRAEGYYEGGGPPEWDYNKNLYFTRVGKVVRNEGREWGKL
ncbi:glycosyltransferase family 2 protein [Desulfosporosinus sp. SYSU MS00001]|uniref:glycosyltransferase family 2 protein n=1 Tax=Desulfosporosinus sp. SYSU MS00001 TaxID=3416284 RepID=UPI003CF8B0C9